MIPGKITFNIKPPTIEKPMPHFEERIRGEQLIEQMEKEKMETPHNMSNFTMGTLEQATFEIYVGPKREKRVTVTVDRTGVRFNLVNSSLDPSFWILHSDLHAISRIAATIRNPPVSSNEIQS